MAFPLSLSFALISPSGACPYCDVIPRTELLPGVLSSCALFAVHTAKSALCGVPLRIFCMDRSHNFAYGHHLPRRDSGKVVRCLGYSSDTHGPSAMLVQRTQGVLDTDCNCRETFCSTGPPGLSSDLGLRTISQSWIWCRATLVRCLQDVSKDSSPILWIARDTVFISFYPEFA